MTIRNSSRSSRIDAAVKAQAKLRAALGIPVLVAMMITAQSLALPFIIHIAYIIAVMMTVRRLGPSSTKALSYLTAACDPLLLSACVWAGGRFGGLLVPFYLFTTLGYGLRIGTRHMLLCQSLALAGFTAVFAFGTYWQAMPIAWLAFLLALIIVPLSCLTAIGGTSGPAVKTPEQLRSRSSHGASRQPCQPKCATGSEQAQIRASLKAQAKLRILLGIPVIAGTVALIANMPEKGTLVWWMMTVHLSYIVLVAVTTRTNRQSILTALGYLTSVLDPLLLSAWLPLMDNAGGLIVGFYLFTILGYGFRLGLVHMLVCQCAAIAGFAIAYALEPYWRNEPLTWLSFLLSLIIVPLYCRSLLRQLHDARHRAEQANAAKSRLLARVSHELRTRRASRLMAPVHGKSPKVISGKPNSLCASAIR